jgi:hypothetical protein
MIDAWVHFPIILTIAAYSVFRKAGVQFLLVVCTYGIAWQLSDYMSRLEDATLLFKALFQASVSIILINSIVNLKYTRFTGFFVLLLLAGMTSLFIMFVLDKFANAATFNKAVDIFNPINISLIYLELLALSGVTFGMGGGKRDRRVDERPLGISVHNRDGLYNTEGYPENLAMVQNKTEI